jgi:hypothetical protein
VASELQRGLASVDNDHVAHLSIGWFSIGEDEVEKINELQERIVSISANDVIPISVSKVKVKIGKMLHVVALKGA